MFWCNYLPNLNQQNSIELKIPFKWDITRPIFPLKINSDRAHMILGNLTYVTYGKIFSIKVFI